MESVDREALMASQLELALEIVLRFTTQLTPISHTQPAQTIPPHMGLPSIAPMHSVHNVPTVGSYPMTSRPMPPIGSGLAGANSKSPQQQQAQCLGMFHQVAILFFLTFFSLPAIPF